MGGFVIVELLVCLLPMAELEEGFGPSSSSEKAGTILRIRVENFMCHSSLSVEFIPYVNFITGQNGSGKSAILTAICVAFGIKARGTQRATSLKDFIKTGCSHALVVVELTNEGIDAFKPNDYGEKIIIERRITESGNTSVLKDSQGKKVSSKKEELQELVDHFNIDVENPCVIMTQDKSREFLHTGTGKEKFKFFFRATLLQQVLDLLNGIKNNIESAGAIIGEMEQELRPSLEELKQLEEKLKSVENVEQMTQKLGLLRKLAAWSEVNDVDQQLQEARVKLEKYRSRIPACEERINKIKETLERHRGEQTAKKAAIALMLQKTKELRQKQDDLQKKLAQATKEDAQIEEDQKSRHRSIQQMMERVRWLEQQIIDIRDLHVQASQAEENEREEAFHRLQSEIDKSTRELSRMEEESNLESTVISRTEETRLMREEVEERKREHRELQAQMRRLQSQQNNKVTAFGGDAVLRLLRVIEEHYQRFIRPPLGPVGAHVALLGNDRWALAIEAAIGKILNAFIVTNHKDMLLLRDCAKRCGYHNLQIIIYDHDRPLLNIPQHMLPDRNLVTVRSVLCIESPTVMNVLIDQGSVERQVLVNDYDEGKHVVFERKADHVKEAFTLDGTRMFTRGGSQTTLPPDTRLQSGRLCAAVDEIIRRVERDVSNVSQDIEAREKRMHMAESTLQALRDELHSYRRRKSDLERHISRQQLKLRDLRNAAHAEANLLGQDPNVDELEQEILKLKSEIQSKEDSLEKLKIRRHQAQENISVARSALDALHDSAKGDIEALQLAENELVAIEEEIVKASNNEAHYNKVMQDIVIRDIQDQAAQVERLMKEYEEFIAKASEICSKEEVDALEVQQKSSDHIKKEMSSLKDRLRREEGRHEESADELRNRFNKQKRRIEKKQNQYMFYRKRLSMVEKALDHRLTKFDRNSSYVRKQLTWKFNGHLGKKGMSGKIQADFSTEMLSIQVQMPQDTSNNMVKDTRGLSGGERSFSTLCFALSLQEMTEAPFRAMDEFDVFMDAVSRKISLDTVVDFAVAHGSQWIFITPHDISMVKTGPHVKKQQLAAPRP